MRSKFIFWDWLKDEIKPIVSATSISINIWPTSATCQFICAFRLLSSRLFETATAYCVIAPPQFASPDKARWLWIYFKTVQHSQDVLSSTFDSVYYFNVIHIYVGFNVRSFYKSRKHSATSTLASVAVVAFCGWWRPWRKIIYNAPRLQRGSISWTPTTAL